MTDENAIHVRGLERGYGDIRVIEGLDMSVPAGSIYALLGPNGCGKTTLLKVLLGRLIPRRGDVSVLGTVPGEKGARVPGSAVGYAPQELALYLDLSIHESLLFHARLHGMSTEDLANREKWLIDFLELPEPERLVGQLSGGQKRRVSLATALLHEPDILLLDEPTVGVDPELRSRIWEHLRAIADEGTTIVITTHYIEESRRATRVGMMRGGVLLAEDNPQTLLDRYEMDSLDDLFLLLCQRQPREDSAAHKPEAEVEGEVAA